MSYNITLELFITMLDCLTDLITDNFIWWSIFGNVQQLSPELLEGGDKSTFAFAFA